MPCSPVELLFCGTSACHETQQGTIDVSPSSAPLIASLVAIIVAWRTKNLLLTIVIGMAALLIWRALFPTS
jgi:branched-subunit amino acid transport protein